MSSPPHFHRLTQRILGDVITLKHGIKILPDCVIINPDGTGFGGGILDINLRNAKLGDELRLRETTEFSTQAGRLYLGEKLVGRGLLIHETASGATCLRIGFEPEVFWGELGTICAAIEVCNPSQTPGKRIITIEITDADNDTASADIELVIGEMPETSLIFSVSEAKREEVTNQTCIEFPKTVPIFTAKVPPPQQTQAIRQTRARYPDMFPDDGSAQCFLYLIVLPASRRWAFLHAGKNAGSSTLRFLFRAEFGVELTADFQPLADINTAAVVHQLAEHEVFSRALYLGLAAQEVASDTALERFCIVRNPYDRAVSSFRYFCKSNEMGKNWFMGDRLRINALAGFDWNTMPYTVEGFRRFLSYIEFEIERVGVHGLDDHWRPQTYCIFPDVFNPTLIGRLEDLPAFYTTVGQRLGCDLSARAIYWDNRQESPDPSLSRDPVARALVEQVFRSDFEAFGY